jgi:hypothetical protein
MNPESPLLRELAKSRLDGKRFDSWNHCSRQQTRPVDIWDFEEGIPLLGWIYLGWCPTAATVRPESSWASHAPGFIAVLLAPRETPEEEVWIHVPVSPEMISAGYGRSIT